MRGLVGLCAFLVVLSVVSAARKSDRNKPKYKTRPILADQLRDFPEVCFASTQCGTVEVGQSWDLKPFCGRSTCAKADDGRLVEVVEECEPAPGPDCKVDERRTDKEAAFPDCCPVYRCPEGGEEQEEQQGQEQQGQEQQSEEPQRVAPRRGSSRRKVSRTRVEQPSDY